MIYKIVWQEHSGQESTDSTIYNTEREAIIDAELKVEKRFSRGNQYRIESRNPEEDLKKEVIKNNGIITQQIIKSALPELNFYFEGPLKEKIDVIPVGQSQEGVFVICKDKMNISRLFTIHYSNLKVESI
mgnify:CR=1